MSIVRCMIFLFLSILISVISAYDVTVSWNEVHQKISGFGGGTGCPDCPGSNPSVYGNTGVDIYKLPEPARTKLLDLMFDSTKGIGLNANRMGMSWLLEDQNGAWKWGQGQYEAAEFWVAREMLKRNSKSLIYAAP